MLPPPPPGRLSSSGDELGCQGWGEGSYWHLQMNSPSTQAFSAEFTLDGVKDQQSHCRGSGHWVFEPVCSAVLYTSDSHLSNNGDPITWLSNQGLNLSSSVLPRVSPQGEFGSTAPDLHSTVAIGYPPAHGARSPWFIPALPLSCGAGGWWS